MNIVGVTTDPNEANEIEDIAKIFVVEQRMKQLHPLSTSKDVKDIEIIPQNKEPTLQPDTKKTTTTCIPIRGFS